MIPDNTRTAHHEAGHAVAAHVLGHGPLDVTVRHGGGGLTRLAPPPVEISMRWRRDLLVVATAGCVAVRIILGQRTPYSGGDQDLIAFIVRRLAGASVRAVEREPEFLVAVERAEHLVHTHRAAILAVAQALLPCGSLSGREVALMCGRFHRVFYTPRRPRGWPGALASACFGGATC